MALLYHTGKTNMHCSQPCSAHTSPSHKYCLALGLNEKESLSDLVLRGNSLQRTEPSHHVARAWPSYYMVGRIPAKILVHFIFLSSFCRLRAESSGSSIQIRKRWELRTMRHPISSLKLHVVKSALLTPHTKRRESTRELGTEAPWANMFFKTLGIL